MARSQLAAGARSLPHRAPGQRDGDQTNLYAYISFVFAYRVIQFLLMTLLFLHYMCMCVYVPAVAFTVHSILK
jgi:hypothetical protein